MEQKLGFACVAVQHGHSGAGEHDVNLFMPLSGAEEECTTADLSAAIAELDGTLGAVCEELEFDQAQCDEARLILWTSYHSSPDTPSGHHISVLLTPPLDSIS